MKMIKLTMVYGRETRPDSNGEDDSVVSLQTYELTKPMILDADQVRNFYPRRNAVGTRILFRNGSALAVSEDMDAVELAIKRAG